jgi:molybdopterin/thiamine biosynthesis adenylyltransferase
MDPLYEALKGASAADRTSYRPVFHRLPADREGLVELLKREPRVQVFDHLHGQLTELIRSLNPSVRYTAADLDAAAITHLKGKPAAEYGVWVYYPWSQRLVHLLDEQEFAVVRTDRNRNKITREEQALLASKKVGVIGLSVGQSVSLTMALERSFGEIRLADFDTLELSNLNRIRSGVHNLGVSKVVNVAREIAEIDPFLKVTCFHEGITRDNIDRFLTEGGNLDVLVEECDSVDVKIYARQRAKALRIPVVMDTSDRGLIDVERFDLEPERPLLHGLLEGLDLSLVERPMTNAEKLPFMGQIVGLATISGRMKASIPELGRTIITWPQLASGVVLGGSIVAEVYRRIMLNELTCSGRWWNDPSDTIAPSKGQHTGIAPDPQT